MSDEYQRFSLPSFNPTLLSSGGGPIPYNYDKWIAEGVLTYAHKMEDKYLFVTYYSNVTIRNFYFNELSTKQAAT